MSPKILLVEDQPDIQLTVRLALELEGHTVTVASDAAGALEALDGEAPDLVLLDITLPRVSGWELLAGLKADRRFGDVPVIVMSALPEEQIASKAGDLGAVGHLAKPFDVQALGRSVRDALRNGGVP